MFLLRLIRVIIYFNAYNTQWIFLFLKDEYKLKKIKILNKLIGKSKILIKRIIRNN